MQKRVNSFDWLRGLMALSIMLYHLGGRNDAASLLGKLGIYGVSIFFILSGLSMAIAYDRHISDLRSAAVFFVRRLFRIWPPLWLAVVLVTVPAYISGQSYDLITIALNLSTTFGFVAPTQYINLTVHRTETASTACHHSTLAWLDAYTTTTRSASCSAGCGRGRSCMRNCWRMRITRCRPSTSGCGSRS